MKHLMLLRHAKAAPAEPGGKDFDRPLAQRGRRDCRLVGQAMAGEPLPDLILCSPSQRTRETLAAILDQLPSEPETALVDGLYEPGGATYLDAISAHGGNSRRLLVIGHNPAIQATALTLVAKPDAALAGKFPTCALAVIGFDAGSWSAIGPGQGRLISFRRPRDLGSRDADD